MKEVVLRMQESTPKFFQKLRNIGVTLLSVSAAVWAVPVQLPTIVTSIAGYIAVAGGVMSAVSQTAVKNEQD